MSQHEPERWADSGETPGALREALLGARRERPSAAQLERMIARASGTSAPAAPSGKRFAWTLSSKWLLGVACFAALGAFLSAAWQTSPRNTPPREASPSAAVKRTAARPVEAPASSNEVPAAPSLAPAELPIAAVPPQPISGLDASPAANPRSGRPGHRSPSKTDGRSVRAADPRAEVELLRRAKLAQTRDPRQAWQLLETHAQRYPNGVFGEEREALAVEVLLELGRADEAKARAKQLRTHFPASPYLRRIDALLR